MVNTHARMTFQDARNIEVHDRVRKYVFRCTKKRVPMLAVIILSFCSRFCHQKNPKHPSYVSLWDVFLWMNLTQYV